LKRSISVILAVLLSLALCSICFATSIEVPSQETGKISYSMTKVYYADEFRVLSYDFSEGRQWYQQTWHDVVSITVPPEFETLNKQVGKLNFQWNCQSGDFYLNSQDHKLEVSLTEPSQTETDKFDTDSWGGLEYTDRPWSGSAKDVAGTNWFYAYRLTDFTNFKSHQMNEFITGFTGNATDVDSPYIRIRAKWIKGFYNGQAFDNNLVIEGRIMDSGSNEDIFVFNLNSDNAVILDPGMPADTTLDLAFEAAEDGRLISFYYRINSDQAELTKESGGWKLAKSCDLATIDPNAILYGYPVNKGIMSLSVSSLSFPVTIPEVSINTGLSVNIVSQDDPEIVTSRDLEEENGLEDFLPIAPQQGVTVNVDDNSIVALRYAFGGADTMISSLDLQKIKDDGTYITFQNYLTDLKAIDGGWTITELDSPYSPLPLNTTLSKDERYYLYLVVKDNGSYDLDPEAGVIYDPTVLGFGGSENTSTTTSGGGGGGGCNIGYLMPVLGALVLPLLFLIRK
jgi:hypothetical protein